MSSSPDRIFDGRVPPPDFVNIETTKYCNLRCEMCHQFQDGTILTGPHLNPDTFDRWADATLPFATRFQPSVTGEPLMSKGLPRMLAKAAEYGVKVELTTNATLLDARMRRLLLPYLGKIHISFDGASKETFEHVRAGADFDQVCENVRALCRDIRALPLGERPVVTLACVIMRSNIEELPAVVDLAVEFGVDELGVSHMHPPTEELKAESLVHDPELAAACIDRALARAEAAGLVMNVQPLDQLVAATVTQGVGRRDYAIVNGAVAGLGERQVNAERRRPWPRLSARDPDFQEIQERRRRARARTDFVPAETANTLPSDTPDSVWVCDFLWNKTYVTLPGDVRTCCVPGTPVIGNMNRQRFDEIWNDPVYRTMRARLVRKDPVPICRGCQHIRELTDPDEISRALQGRATPDAKAFADLPATLDPFKVRLLSPTSATDLPPVLTWDAARGARGYEVELSVDRFATLAFASSWHGPLLSDNRFEVPEWAWQQAPRDRPIFWRAVAWLPQTKLEVGLGVLQRTDARTMD